MVESGKELNFVLLLDQESFYSFLQCFSRNSSDDTVFLLTVFEDDNGGNAAYPITVGCVWTLVGVDFVEFELPCEILGQLVNYRVNHTARSTPWCPEFDQNWDI